MATYTVLNTIDLQTILLEYDIQEIQSFRVLHGGSENTNYLVSTMLKKYVLTICEQKTPKKTEELAFLLEHLEQNNFTTSKVVKTKKGSLVTIWKTKPVMIKEYLEGDIVTDLSKKTLNCLGKELAKLHQIKAPDYLSDTVDYGIEKFDRVKKYAPDSSFYFWLKTTQKYIEEHISTELPKALIHSDIFYNNVIVSKEGKQATIMDFEEACYYYRVFDIGMVIIGTCCMETSVNREKIQQLLQGYEAENKLMTVEKKVLKAFTVYAATATAFWRYQNFNFIHVVPHMKNHYLAMRNLADAVQKLPDTDFSL